MEYVFSPNSQENATIRQQEPTPPRWLIYQYIVLSYGEPAKPAETSTGKYYIADRRAHSSSPPLIVT